MAKTGKGRQTYKFYGGIDAIVGHWPASVPSVLEETSGEDLSKEEEIGCKNWAIVRLIHALAEGTLDSAVT